MKTLQENYTHALRQSGVPEALQVSLQEAFPLLHKKLDAPAWASLIKHFFQTHSIKTPYYHEIPDEFVEYLHLHSEKHYFELAHYDWVEGVLALESTDLNAIPCDPHGDVITSIPVISPLAYVLHYETFTENYHLAYRNRAHQINYLIINLFSATLFELLKNNATLSGEALLEQLAIQTEHPTPELLKENGIRLLHEWHEKDIILGTLC